MADTFSKGLRALLFVCKYTDLWMAINLDGYGSHLQGDRLEVFAVHNISIVKEEGETSQVCQVYNKDLYLSNKRHHCRLLNGIRAEISMVDQWNLGIVANKVCTFCILFDLLMNMMT